MKRFEVRLPDPLYESLREVAHLTRQSMNSLIVKALEADEEVKQELKRRE